MTIIGYSNDVCSIRKGFHYDKQTSLYDQITSVFGKTGPRNCPADSPAIFWPVFPPRFYTSTAICNYGSSAVFQDGLSWYNPVAAGVFRAKEHTGDSQSSTLYHRSEGTAANAKKNAFKALLGKIFDRARACGLANQSSSNVCSADSTGLEDHYVSRHFIMRQNSRTSRYRRWTKLLIVADNDTHLIGSAAVSVGPSTDCHQLQDVVGMAVDNMPVKSLLADSGFDSEYNHRICREQFGIGSTVIAVNDRNLKYGKIGGFFRRKMKRYFPKVKYRQRWQIESVFSRFKRRLGYHLTARKDSSRTLECYLRVLTYNMMILYLLFTKSFFINLFYKANLIKIIFRHPCRDIFCTFSRSRTDKGRFAQP